MGISGTQTRGIRRFNNVWETPIGRALKTLPAPILVDFIIYEMTSAQVQKIVKKVAKRGCGYLPIVRQVKIFMGLFNTAYDLLTHPLVPTEAMSSFLGIETEANEDWLVARVIWDTAGDQIPDNEYNQECTHFAELFVKGQI